MIKRQVWRLLRKEMGDIVVRFATEEEVPLHGLGNMIGLIDGGFSKRNAGRLVRSHSEQVRYV